MKKHNIVFGPINSRRFGMSLGVDLSPSHKQCNFDCLYCELAPQSTVDSQIESIAITDIINELSIHLNDSIDVITLTANGEPTLYPHIDSLIDEINKIKGDTQTLILTNSATLSDKNVFNSLLKLDQVKLSLDAISADVFKKIDRPHKNIDINNLVDKVIEFSKIYTGKLFIEILFVHELNNTTEEIKKLNEALMLIECERVDIGTIDRPPAYPVVGVSYEELFNISLLFNQSIPIHIASRQHAVAKHKSYTNDEIINTIDKRPLTMKDINLLFDKQSIERLKILIKNNKIKEIKNSNLDFLVLTKNVNRKKQKSKN